MNYENATNDELEVKLGELIGMGKLGALNSPRYCTDWNATMPMAVENGVYYYPSKNGYEGRVVTKQDRNGHYYNQKSNEDNPLRAIVICLIKVLEAKQ